MPETTTKMRGISMTARNVPKIMDGSKTQTRRIINPQPPFFGGSIVKRHGNFVMENYKTESKRPFDNFGRFEIVKPSHEPGDVFYVREALENGDDDGCCTFAKYKCDGERVDDQHDIGQWYKQDGTPYKTDVIPARFMPKAAARTFIEITEVRCERIQDISYADCEAEGADCRTDLSWNGTTGGADFYNRGFKAAFKELWDETNGKGAWERNDWVFAYTFKLISH